jgi:hypothetical protein
MSRWPQKQISSSALSLSVGTREQSLFASIVLAKSAALKTGKVSGPLLHNIEGEIEAIV